MIVSITGHRPDKLGGYKTPNPIYEAVMEGLSKALIELKPKLVVTGMALGVDQWAAQICYNKEIPYLAAVPFDGQELVWPAHAQHLYKMLLSRAAQAYVISPGTFEPHKMQIRNRWMVDQSDMLLAVWNGSQGGTSNCVGYAKSIQKKIKFVEIPPHIWDLAAKTAPPKKPSLHQVKPNLLHNYKKIPVLAPDGMAIPSPISPFVSKIKEKAQEEANKQMLAIQGTAKELQLALELIGKEQSVDVVQLLKTLKSDSYDGMAELEKVLQKFNDDSKKHGGAAPVKVSSKPTGETYHRVLDLDE